MKFLVLWLAVALGWPGAFCSLQKSDVPGRSEKSGTLVGMVKRNFTDATRKNWEGTGPRPETTVVWYPAASGSKETNHWGDPSMRPANQRNRSAFTSAADRS